MGEHCGYCEYSRHVWRPSPTFLFGMSTMTDGLEKLSSGRLEHILERLTSNVFKVRSGAVVTGLIQSSAATTVMCVGFVTRAS